MSYFDHFSHTDMTRFGAWLVGKVKQSEFKIILPFLSVQDDVLEIGPGWGEMQDLLSKAGFLKYAAVEPNPTLRKHLMEKGVHVKDYFIPALNEESEQYHFIYLSDVYEHLNGTAEASQFIQEVCRVLKPGGYICISSPDYFHWKEDFFISDYTHENITSVRRIIQIFQNNGLLTVKHEYLSGFITGKLATLSSLLARVGLTFTARDGVDNKLYKLFISFLRRFIIIGMKPKPAD
jgi:SAM-dependent methyltransferase